MWTWLYRWMYRRQIDEENRRFVRRLRMLRDQRPELDFDDDDDLLRAITAMGDDIPQAVIEVLPITQTLRRVSDTFQRDVFTFQLAREVSFYISGRADAHTHQLITSLLEHPNTRLAVYQELLNEGTIHPHQRRYYLAGDNGDRLNDWLYHGHPPR